MRILYFLTAILLVERTSSLLQPFSQISENSYFNNECVCTNGTEEDIKNAIKKTYDDIEKIRISEMISGVVAGISIKGKDVWIEAFGETDIENGVKTHKDSVWRMGSISKSLTTALIGKLIDKGLVDLDSSIHQYLKPSVFPIKQWNNKNVTITVKQVMSHRAGLRVTQFPDDFENIYNFKNVTQTISQFKDVPLLFEPGTNFNYSNYGYQIIGAIIESVMNETYESAINKMFKELGMNSTFAERHEMIIPHRARYYMKNTSPFNKNNKNITKVEIINTLIADDLVSMEAQWPSGGIVSTVPDLLKFGNHMLSIYKGVDDPKSGYIKSSTLKKLWTPTSSKVFEEVLNTAHYAEGWVVVNLTQPITCSGSCKSPPISQIVGHLGGLAGVSTILLILPEQDFVIAVFSNVGNNDINNFDMALRIATNFV